MSNNVTLELIGRACGVSHITASRALRGLGNVKPETARRIRDYAKSAGYQMRSVEKKLPRTRPMLLPYNEYYVGRREAGSTLWDYIEGIVQASSQVQQSIEVVSFTGVGSVDLDYLRPVIEQGELSGVLNLGLSEEALAYLTEKKIPMVSRLNNVYHLGRNRGAVVYPDQIQGYFTAWEYLFGLGHRRVGYLYKRGEKQHLNPCAAASHLSERLPKLDLVIELDPADLSGSLMAELRQRPRALWPTVFFCGNDQLANQVIALLGREGISVPGDLSIFGFDDSPAAVFCNPAITTLRNPRQELGAAMVHMLRDIISGRPNSQNRVEVLPLQLIERDSVRRIA